MSYSLAGKIFYITPLKLIIALLLFVFALFDIVSKLMKLNFDPKPFSGSSL
ncbi:MAG: hypothetical protein R3218_00560 [Christiangramia sp.]|nr:hypothetical protein [Christiangramia sp.]